MSYSWQGTSPLTIQCTKWHVVMLQSEAEDERAVAGVQEEAGGGVEREVALLHTRLRLLASHALVSPCTCPPINSCCSLLVSGNKL